MKIPKKTADRLKGEIGKFQRVLKDAKDRDVNESDTVTIITDILSDVFGFDKYAEITSEQVIRGTYCDLAVKLGGKIQYLIEVKAIGINLKENHLRQAINYGANHGIPWVVLTNGIVWEIYKIKFERPIDCEQIVSFNFTELSAAKQNDQELVYLLCKKGLVSDAIEKFHDHIQTVNRFTIGAIILSETFLSVVCKELRRVSPGLKVASEEIKEIIVSEVLKRDIVDNKSVATILKKINKPRKKQAKPSLPKNDNTPSGQENPS